MTRLRKAGGEAPAQAAAAAADDLADELEDEEASPAPAKVAASKAAAGTRGASATPSQGSKAKRSSPGKSGSQGGKKADAAAKGAAKAAAKALAEADSEAEELSASTSSEAGAEEGEEEASPSPSSSKKSKKGSAQKLALSKAGGKGGKVDGVGTGAIKAAALHGNFDVRWATWRVWRVMMQGQEGMEWGCLGWLRGGELMAAMMGLLSLLLVCRQPACDLAMCHSAALRFVSLHPPRLTHCVTTTPAASWRRGRLASRCPSHSWQTHLMRLRRPARRVAHTACWSMDHEAMLGHAAMAWDSLAWTACLAAAGGCHEAAAPAMPGPTGRIPQLLQHDFLMLCYFSHPCSAWRFRAC